MSFIQHFNVCLFGFVDGHSLNEVHSLVSTAARKYDKFDLTSINLDTWVDENGDLRYFNNLNRFTVKVEGIVKAAADLEFVQSQILNILQINYPQFNAKNISIDYVMHNDSPARYDEETDELIVESSASESQTSVQYSDFTANEVANLKAFLQERDQGIAGTIKFTSDEVAGIKAMLADHLQKIAKADEDANTLNTEELTLVRKLVAESKFDNRHTLMTDEEATALKNLLMIDLRKLLEQTTTTTSDEPSVEPEIETVESGEVQEVVINN